MKRFLKPYLVLSLLISFFATNVFADDDSARNQSCGSIAAQCERNCEGTSGSGSCIAACRRDYQECTSGSSRKSDIPNCVFPETPCQVGDDEYVCKTNKACSGS